MKSFFTRFFIKVKINQVVEYLAYSDILMLSGWGLISPIIAVFFTEQIKGGTVALAGFASAVYFFTKSIIQVPIARYIDLKKGEKDDYWVMVVGSCLTTTAAFLYIFASLPWHVLCIQCIHGIGGALSYPAWFAIFTRHVDKKQEGFEWSIYSTSTDIGAALSGALGGSLVASFGYNTVFLIVGTMSLIGTFFLMGIAKKLKNR